MLCTAGIRARVALMNTCRAAKAFAVRMCAHALAAVTLRESSTMMESRRGKNCGVPVARPSARLPGSIRLKLSGCQLNTWCTRTCVRPWRGVSAHMHACREVQRVARHRASCTHQEREVDRLQWQKRPERPHHRVQPPDGAYAALARSTGGGALEEHAHRHGAEQSDTVRCGTPEQRLRSQTMKSG